MPLITGTFLDEITHDIPSQNWGPDEWRADFDAMRAVGIDTVILIRAGYRRHVTFNSDVLARAMGTFPAYIDLVDLFLAEAERCGMAFYFGTYDSGRYWVGGEFQKEVDLNRAFCDEVVARYGHREAFKGWYICHEIDTYDEGVMRVYEELSDHLRALKPLPILISPYTRGVKQFGADAISLEQHVREWDQALQRLQGKVDIVAFQDGQVAYEELTDFVRANAEMARRYGIQSWSNVESFCRDMPIKFPPLDWQRLRYKMERAHAAGVDKLITFEFSHFMSPNSCYPSARNLYERYRAFTADERRALAQ